MTITFDIAKTPYDGHAIEHLGTEYAVNMSANTTLALLSKLGVPSESAEYIGGYLEPSEVHAVGNRIGMLLTGWVPISAAEQQYLNEFAALFWEAGDRMLGISWA